MGRGPGIIPALCGHAADALFRDITAGSPPPRTGRNGLPDAATAPLAILRQRLRCRRRRKRYSSRCEPSRRGSCASSAIVRQGCDAQRGAHDGAAAWHRVARHAEPDAAHSCGGRAGSAELHQWRGRCARSSCSTDDSPARMAPSCVGSAYDQRLHSAGCPSLMYPIRSEFKMGGSLARRDCYFRSCPYTAGARPGRVCHHFEWSRGAASCGGKDARKQNTPRHSLYYAFGPRWNRHVCLQRIELRTG